MATKEGTRASIEFICVSIVPDVCKSPTIPVPYKILSLFNCAVNYSTTVRFRKQWVFRHDSRLSTVRCDEPGVGGGVLSGVNMGFCRPIPTMHSKTVRVNGQFVDYHEGTYMFMNCAGPEGPFNTIGQVKFLGNMLPGPVTPSGKVPKGCILGKSGILSDIQSSLGDVDDLIKKAKSLYALAKTDWSNPGAVLGALGGLAGIAGLQETAGMIGKAKQLYDTGKQLANTNWSNPLQALSTIAGVANVANMPQLAKAAGLANTIASTIKADWSNPQAALTAATNIMKATGLNQMAAQLASNLILDSKIPVSQSGTTPPFFPKPGGQAAGSTATNSKSPNFPDSKEGKPRQPITADIYDYLKQTNPTAAARYDALSGDEKNNAFIEFPKDGADKNRAAIFVPGDGFTTTQAERDGLPNVSQFIPPSIREIFVADHKDATEGNFVGIKEKEGNVYLFGGLIDLGSPEMPGAGTSGTWWVPDRILNMDMSKYYDYHDKDYYGDNVTLGDIGKILGHELEAFKAGANENPLQLPLQTLYSLATTSVGVGTALGNSISNLFSGQESQPPVAVGQTPAGAQTSSFDSLKDLFGGMLGSGSAAPTDSPIMNIVPGGCMGPEVPTLPGQSAPGTGSGAPGIGAPPKTGSGGAPQGKSSGAGKDGVLITTKQGNPAAAAAAIEAGFRAANDKALEDAETQEQREAAYADRKGAVAKEPLVRPTRPPDYYRKGPGNTQIPVWEEPLGRDLGGEYKADSEGPFIVVNKNLPDYQKAEEVKHELGHANNDYENAVKGAPPFDNKIANHNQTEQNAERAEIAEIEKNKNRYPSKDAYDERLDAENEKLAVLRGSVEPDDIDDIAILQSYGANPDKDAITDEERAAANREREERKQREQERNQREIERENERRRAEKEREDAKPDPLKEIEERLKNPQKPAPAKKPPDSMEQF